jgi:hypothetical protein
MTNTKGTTKAILLLWMLGLLSFSQTPISLSSETYQVEKTGESELNYFYYVDRSAASQNYHFISSNFDEATEAFKIADYEVTNQDF